MYDASLYVTFLYKIYFIFNLFISINFFVSIKFVEIFSSKGKGTSYLFKVIYLKINLKD